MAHDDPDENRRQELRREEDRLVEYRLQRIEETAEGFETTLRGLGSASGHLALLDSRVDENRRRITVVERTVDKIEASVTEMKVALEGVRVRVAVAAAFGSIGGAGLVALLVKWAGG